MALGARVAEHPPPASPPATAADSSAVLRYPPQHPPLDSRSAGDSSGTALLSRPVAGTSGLPDNDALLSSFARPRSAEPPAVSTDRPSTSFPAAAALLSSLAVLSPIARYVDTQPIRAVAFRPPPSGGHRSGNGFDGVELDIDSGEEGEEEDGGMLFAVGTNSRALRLLRAPRELLLERGDDAAAWPPLLPPPSADLINSWAGHHLGSVYALSWWCERAAASGCHCTIRSVASLLTVASSDRVASAAKLPPPS
jgi:hypothetical protein